MDLNATGFAWLSASNSFVSCVVKGVIVICGEHAETDISRPEVSTDGHTECTACLKDLPSLATRKVRLRSVSRMMTASLFGQGSQFTQDTSLCFPSLYSLQPVTNRRFS